MLMVCASAILATSCLEDKPYNDASMTIATEVLNFAYGGGSQDVTLSTDYEKWSARPNVAWITITQGDGKFTVTANPNDPGRDREGKIVVTSGRMRHEIKVTQGGDILVLSPARLDFTAAAETKNATVEVIRKSWTTEIVGDWISVVNRGDTILVVTVTANPWDAPARNGKIYVKTDTKRDSIIIAQARDAAPPLPPNYNATIAYTGRFINANDQEFAVADVKLTGADVASAKVALVPGKWDESFVDEIIEGDIESVEIKANATVQRPTSGAGDYSYVVVTYSKDDKPQLAFYDEFYLADLSGGGDLPTIDDFIGYYKLTGPSQFSGRPEADMDVEIAAGDDVNTLIITGITYAEEVIAIFDPATGTMSIAPQELADFGKYDVTLVTTTPDGDITDPDDDEIAAMVFSRTSNGRLVMTETSEGDGYLLYSDEADGFISGFYDLVFIPSAPPAASSSKRTAVSNTLKAIEFKR